MQNKMIKDLIKYVAGKMMHRLTRSSLTILSVLIGIMAIFALVSFGQGLSKYVDQISQESGADRLIAQPKGFGPPGSAGAFLTENDLNVIKKTIGVSEAIAMIAQQAEVKGKAVLGFNYQLPDKIFAKPLKVGDSILVNGQPFNVIGFYEEIGNPQDDLNVYMTKEDAKETFNLNDEYAFIYIRSAEGVSPTKLASRLEEKLRKEKGQKEGEEDFFVQTYEQLIETFSTVLVVLNSILVIIAGISILVAAVNIMNTMYNAVLERTKEIGVMKSIGARNSTILFM